MRCARTMLTCAMLLVALSPVAAALQAVEGPAYATRDYTYFQKRDGYSLWYPGDVLTYEPEGSGDGVDAFDAVTETGELPAALQIVRVCEPSYTIERAALDMEATLRSEGYETESLTLTTRVMFPDAPCHGILGTRILPDGRREYTEGYAVVGDGAIYFLWANYSAELETSLGVWLRTVIRTFESPAQGPMA